MLDSSLLMKQTFFVPVDRSFSETGVVVLTTERVTVIVECFVVPQ
jgi:hypothetical protein